MERGKNPNMLVCKKRMFVLGSPPDIKIYEYDSENKTRHVTLFPVFTGTVLTYEK
jgi:hypothetical protein